MNLTLNPKCDPTPILTKLEDSSRILCSRPRPFDSASLFLEVFSTMHISTLCLLLHVSSSWVSTQIFHCPSSWQLMVIYEIIWKFWGHETANTTEFQIFLFSKAFGHSCHWAVALSWTWRRTQGSLSPCFKICSFSLTSLCTQTLQILFFSYAEQFKLCTADEWHIRILYLTRDCSLMWVLLLTIKITFI